MRYLVELKCCRSVIVENAANVTLLDGSYCITGVNDDLLFLAPKEEVSYITKMDEE